MTAAFPIDSVFGDLDAALDSGVRAIVIEAPPGAGKTTRIPARIARREKERGLVVVSEPRRIAARLSARFVAQQWGCRLGTQVGYRVRFEDRTSRGTRLIYVTEALLLRHWLTGDKATQDASRATMTPETIGTVILDEVHERSADLDLLLALFVDAPRPIRLIAMSATLESEKLARYLGPDTLVLRSEGRTYPVERHFAVRPDNRPLALQVRSVVRETLQQPGDTLVFLPGIAEIRACASALSELADVSVEALHGDLPIEKQSSIVESAGGTDRVILSTNVAESSLTLQGVTKVIDSGLSRTSVFDPWSQVQRLETLPISQARAIQRAGRAGRVAPGAAWFLGTRGDFDRRPEQDVPEMLRTDLSRICLQVLAHSENGGPPLEALRFLAPPPQAAIQSALQLLTLLGAWSNGRLTPLGRIMSIFPIAPRLSRTLIQGAKKNMLGHACLAVALLSERDPLRHRNEVDVVAVDSDLDERMDLMRKLWREGLTRKNCEISNVDERNARQITQVAESLYRNAVDLKDRARRSTARKLATSDAEQWQLMYAGGDEPARLAPELRDQLAEEDGRFPTTRFLIPGWYDRIGRRRDRSITLASGVQAQLSPASGLRETDLLLALSMDSPRGKSSQPLIRWAARVDPDWLFDDGPHLDTEEDIRFQAEKGRLERVSRLRWGRVVIDESVDSPEPGPQVARAWAKALLPLGSAVFDPEDRLGQLRQRLSLADQHHPTHIEKALGEAHSTVNWRQKSALAQYALEMAGQRIGDLKSLKKEDLAGRLMETWPHELSRWLDEVCPLQIRLKSGLSVPIHYEEDRVPWLEARLQNFFSMTETPSLFGGRLPLAIHLLAPNHRPVQVTSDLAGFWERHYPELRKQLMRRYPRHLWPEDGLTAHPPIPGRIR